MGTYKWMIAALILLVGSTSTAYAEITVSTAQKHYLVRGKNIQNIRQSIRHEGIKDNNGNVFTAKTSPVFTWKYHFAHTAGSCSIESVDINIELTYYLPKLANDTQLNDQVKSEWQRYSQAVYKHEQGHAAISMQAAKEIEWEALNITPKSSCGEVGRTANILISNIFNRNEYQQFAYDSHTMHGVSQGAVLAELQ